MHTTASSAQPSMKVRRAELRVQVLRFGLLLGEGHVDFLFPCFEQMHVVRRSGRFHVISGVEELEHGEIGVLLAWLP